jgi:hypothetical protein
MNGIRTNSAGARGINWNEWESIGGLDVIVDEISRRLSQATRIVASLGGEDCSASKDDASREDQKAFLLIDR